MPLILCLFFLLWTSFESASVLATYAKVGSAAFKAIFHDVFLGERNEQKRATILGARSLASATRHLVRSSPTWLIARERRNAILMRQYLCGLPRLQRLLRISRPLRSRFAHAKRFSDAGKTFGCNNCLKNKRMASTALQCATKPQPSLAQRSTIYCTIRVKNHNICQKCLENGHKQTEILSRVDSIKILLTPVAGSSKVCL